MKLAFSSPHPGEYVREDCLKPLGLTVTQAAKALDVNRVTLSRLVNEQSGVSPEMAVRLEQVFGLTAELWLRLQNSYDLEQVARKKIKLRRLSGALRKEVAKARRIV